MNAQTSPAQTNLELIHSICKTFRNDVTNAIDTWEQSGSAKSWTTLQDELELLPSGTALPAAVRSAIISEEFSYIGI